MLRKSLQLLACLAALAGGVGAPLLGAVGRPLIRNFEVRETGGEPYYWTTVQDERGVLYFGCNIVVTFDGEHWRQYAVPGSYAVRALALGTGGRLWVGAINEIGYFDRTPTGELSAYHSLVSALPADGRNIGDVWSVFARQNGAVFVTSNAVLVWDGSAFHVDHLPGARRLTATEVEGQIYVSHLSKGVFVVDGSELRPFIPASALNNSGCGWMEKTAQGWLLATNQGLVRYEDGGMIPFSSPEATAYIRQHVITSATRLANGDIGVATASGGLLVLTGDGKVRRHVTQQDGLLTNSLCTLFADRDDSVWITSLLGISRVVLGKGVSIVDRHDGLTGRPCKSIVESGGKLFVSTNDGVFSLPIDGSTGVQAEPVTPFASVTPSGLAVQADGVYLAGFKGVDRLANGSSSHVFSTSKDVLLLHASAQQPGTFLATVEFDLVRLTPDAAGELEATELARLPDSAISVAEDAEGTVWAGTSSRGVFRIPSVASAEPVALHNADGKPYSGRGLVARIGTHIAVCTDSGVVLCRDANSPAIPVANSPHVAPLQISNQDQGGRIWIAYPSPFKGGARVALVGRLSIDAQGIGHWTPVPIPGLATIDDLSCLYVDQHGVLCIGGSDGLLRIQPDKLQPAGAPHAPMIAASVAAGSSLPWSRNTAALDFGTVEYLRPEAVRFQTRLLPGGGDWSEPTDNSHLALAGLSDDAYDFEVRTVNDAGLTSAPATWHFTVLPPWYRTKVAWTVWTLLAGGACLGLVQWRSAWLRQRNVKLEELIQRRTAELQKANAAKSEFLANMSHEIRNPISGIVGLSIAMEDTALNGRQQQLVDSIRSCASLLATLVDDVLDFSKIEAGRIELRPAPFHLRSILEQCTAMVAEEIRDKNGTLSLVITPELPARFIGDSARVQQIIVNYLTNALKFSPGKPIVVGAEPAGPGRVRLYVKDRGPGLSEADIAVLFTKFTRLERARSGNIRGTGLGLAVCRLLATKMGGTVGVDSKPGDGSRFWVELPLPIALDTAPPPEAAPAAAVPLRALIVEDIDYNGIAMQAVLRKLGIGSEVVADGPAALARMLNSTFDVVFMDWNLPGMIGTEVVSRYRSLEPANRRTIIIATTAYSQDMNREACLQAGMDAFISKPFTPEKIAAALADLRESRRAAASVEIRSSVENSAVFAGLDLQFLRFAGSDSSDALREVIDRYLATFRDDIAAAWQALEGGSGMAQINAIAHRLVNHARVVKAETLIHLATDLESNGTLTPAGRRNLLAQIEREFERIRDILDSIRSSAQPA